MNLATKLGTPALLGGLLLNGGAIAQVIQERPADRTAPGNTAILTDADPADARADHADLRRVSAILKGEARGPGDEGRIAAISDLIMDAEGRPHYVLLSRGGVAGLGGEKIAVPFSAAMLARDEDGDWYLPLTMTGDQLDQAPTLEEGSLAQLRDQNWLRINRDFFQAEAARDEAGTGDDSFLFRASALKGAQVHGSAGEDSIANVDDVILGGDFRATHAVLGYGGVAGLGKNQVPVPFSMLRLNAEREGDQYRLVVGVDLTKERLHGEAAPKLDGEYGRLADPTFIERVDSYFGHDGAATGTGAGLAEPRVRP